MTLMPHDNHREVDDRYPVENQMSSPASTTTRPIRVMHIISDLSIGGAEMTLYKQLEKTDRRRFEPVVVSLVDRGALRERIEALGIAVHTTHMRSGWPSPLGLWRLIKLIRSLRPDLILGWMYHSCLAAELARICSGRRIPVLWSVHYSFSSLASEKRLTAAVVKLCGLLSRLPEKIVFVSSAGQTQHQLLGYCAEKSCVIPNGIDVNEFVPSNEARLSVRAELGLAEDAFLIGVIGRYHPTKDHANFLAAAGVISKTDPDTHFVLIGREIDERNVELSEAIRRLGIEGRTHLLGERQDTPRLAAALDVFSLSSYDESCPNVIGEAMACGVPCVVTDVGDTVWIVGDTGSVIPRRDSQALALAWKDMIRLGAAGRKALGSRARERVVGHFPIEAAVARYEALYDSVLSSGTREAAGFGIPQRLGALKPTLEETARN
jgi:glycosyltransferase involved in cell wall biosynthesis